MGLVDVKTVDNFSKTVEEKVKIANEDFKKYFKSINKKDAKAFLQYAKITVESNNITLVYNVTGVTDETMEVAVFFGKDGTGVTDETMEVAVFFGKDGTKTYSLDGVNNLN